MNNKKYYSYFFILGLAILVSFFIWGKKCLAEPILEITNIQYSGGADKANEDFIEITNISADTINLKSYCLVKRTAFSGKEYYIYQWEKDTLLSSGEKYVWANNKNDFNNIIKANIGTSATISETNGIALRFGKINTGNIIDSLNWKWTDDSEEEEEEEIKNYSGITINEIYPAPPAKNSEKWKNLDDECLKNEFVEIENKEKIPIDFSHWTIRDEKGNSSKIISQITAKNFIVFCGSFSLNNDSKGDTVFLYDEENKLIDKKSYQSGKGQFSYSFDGNIWRWTSQPTPGKDNLFDKKLSAKIEKEKDLYQNVYAYFNLKAPAEAKKFVWDFGDGHRSYLKNTRHKYENTGKFNVSVKISGKGETSWQEFSVTVKKYRAPKIKIVKLSPNPKDKDSKYEWIEIENKSRKKVNLKNWSIATGWEKLYNHPIQKDFVIQPGKTKKLTRSVCAFTLANNKTTIELHDPSGKIIQKISYNKKNETVREEENYQKTKDGWKWTNLKSSKILAKINFPKNYPLPIAFPETKKENLPKLSGYSINPAWQEKKIKMEKIVFINSKIKVPQNKIALLEKEREAKIKISYDYYFFTKTSPQKHWLIVLKENYWKKTNLFLNKFFLKINF